MIDIVTVIVLIVMAAAWLAVSLRRDMQMFQQNSYRNDRYLKWLRMSGDSSSIARITTLASLFLILAFPYSWGYGVAAGLVAALAVQDCVVLDVAVFTDPDRAVPAHGRVEPHARIPPDLHVADDGAARGEVCCFVDFSAHTGFLSDPLS